MSRPPARMPLFVIGGLTLAAAILGYLSVPDQIVAPRKEDHPSETRSKDGCYRIINTAILDRPGCFVLEEDLNFGKGDEFFLVIRSSDVDVNLNGKTVTGPGRASVQAGIYIDGGDGITIRNGTLRNFMFGIRGEPDRHGNPLNEVEIRDVVVENASIIGIKIDANKASLYGNRIDHQESIIEKDSGYIFDVMVDSSQCHYKGNRVAPYKGPEPSNPFVKLPDSCVVEN